MRSRMKIREGGRRRHKQSHKEGADEEERQVYQELSWPGTNRVCHHRSLSFFSPCHRRRAQRWLRLGQCAAQESRCQDGITGPSHLCTSFAVVVLLQATLAALPSDHLMPILPISSLSNQISYIGLLIHMQPRSCRCRSLSVLFGLPLPRLHSMNPWYTIAISAYRFKLRTPSAQVYDAFHPLAEAARSSLVFLRTSGKLHQREPICGAHMHPYLPTVAFMVLISH